MQSNPLMDEVAKFLGEIKHRYTTNTVDSYGTGLKQFASHLNAIGITSWYEIIPEDVAQYDRYLEQGVYSASSRHLKITSTKGFLAYLKDCGTIEENAVFKRALPKISSRKAVSPLDKADVNAVLDAPHDSAPLTTRNRALVGILYDTGLETSDVISIDLSQLHLSEDNYITFGSATKRRKDMVVPMQRETASIIMEYIDRERPSLVKSPSEEAVFLNARGSRLTRQGAWMVIKEYSRHAHVEGVTPRALRNLARTSR